MKPPRSAAQSAPAMNANVARAPNKCHMARLARSAGRTRPVRSSFGNWPTPAVYPWGGNRRHPALRRRLGGLGTLRGANGSRELDATTHSPQFPAQRWMAPWALVSDIAACLGHVDRGVSDRGPSDKLSA